MLKAVLPKPPRIAFRNPKTLRDKLVRSKLKLTDDAERGNFHVEEVTVKFVIY